MDTRIIEQLELDLDMEEILTIDISADLEMQLQFLAEAHNMNIEDYLANRFTAYLERALNDQP